MNEKLSNDFSSPCGRPFKTSLPSHILPAIQRGTLRNTYRSRAFRKNPFDIALYLRLLDRLRPRTVIEIGTYQGGSALWFADVMDAVKSPARVVSIDQNLPGDLSDPRISFRVGDAAALENVLDARELTKLPRPWLVTEDSAHTFSISLAVLKFFDRYLAAGDYIVIEDGILGDMPEKMYERYENGPNRAVAAFLAERGADYAIDAELCDQFGYNATWNPNAWLRRTKA